MTRAAVPGLPTRYPIGELLPALYADDDLAQRFTAGLDTVLAPVFATLDNLAAYLDPALAPADFLHWLAGWVGVDVAPTWPEEVRRAVVARAVELHRRRGTHRGLIELLWLCCGVRADVVDGGGAAWSSEPNSVLPGTRPEELLVRVWPVRTPDVDRERVLEVVAASCPVHLTHRVEILPGPPDQRGD
ncbi:phage tail protein I [Embleya sp. MST-111070]|uniref:phage tail protein I n=1 Tax=Embleya sp. MST-111070 TaxID=3398231 RepID=UPI003F73D134